MIILTNMAVLSLWGAIPRNEKEKEKGVKKVRKGSTHNITWGAIRGLNRGHISTIYI
jgi:hypothetical protein